MSAWTHMNVTYIQASDLRERENERINDDLIKRHFSLHWPVCKQRSYQSMQTLKHTRTYRQSIACDNIQKNYITHMQLREYKIEKNIYVRMYA